MNKYICKKKCVINNTVIDKDDIVCLAELFAEMHAEYFIKIDESNPPIILFPDSVDILRQTVVAIDTTKIFCCYGVYDVEMGKVYNIPERAYDKKAFKKIEPIYTVVNERNISPYYTKDKEEPIESPVYNLPIDSLIPPMEDDDTFFDDNGILTKRQNKAKDDEDEQEEDMVNHPSHYTWLKEKCGIEVIDITRHLDFDIGNAVKYLLRHGHKPEKGLTIKKKAIQDLEKAIFYIKDKIEQIKKEW